MKLNWRKEQDENHNSMWIAEGPYTDGEEYPLYDYKIRTHLFNDKVHYLEVSDSRLLIDKDEPGIWESLEDAMEAIQSHDEDIMAEEAALEDAIDKTNKNLAAQILFEDPLTFEELRPSKAPYTSGLCLILEVENKDGTQKWKHTILTEEI